VSKPSKLERLLAIDHGVPHEVEALEESAFLREASLDRTIEDSFPANDPPSSIPNPYDEGLDLLDHVDQRHVLEDRGTR